MRYSECNSRSVIWRERKRPRPTVRLWNAETSDIVCERPDVFV